MLRIEGIDKLTGKERYIDDLPIDGSWLWGMTVRSPVARGRMTGIHFSREIDWSEFVIVDHRDIPSTNEVAMIENDMPVLADHAVRYIHEPVLLLAHPDRQVLRRAVQSITIETEPLLPVYDYLSPPSSEQIQYGDGNVFTQQSICKGMISDSVWENAPYVVEGVYETGAQEHVYLETQGMLAYETDGVLNVTGSLQCPYYVLRALMHALGRDSDHVRVIQSPTGGAFGGKEDFPSLLAIHTALLTLKACCPVKMIYDRAEDMAVTTKRHPACIRHRTAVERGGRLLAQYIDVTLNGGAYVTLSPVVLSRAIIHAAGPYSCERVAIDGRAVMTNSVPFGAFRGFGAPQVHFANERHMDVIARTIGMDSVELRRVNLIRDGETTATGQVIRDSADRVAVLDQAVQIAGYERKQVEHARFNTEHPYLRRGIGVATFHHGAGFTGSGEADMKSRVEVAGLCDGTVEVRTANTEMGQGTTTVFTQIVSEYLDYHPNDVHITTPDTSHVPDSGPTVASRTSMIVGNLIERACDDLRSQILDSNDACGATLKSALIRWHVDSPGEELVGKASYHQPSGLKWDQSTFTGDAYEAFAWATYLADVEVDLRTCITTVTDFTAVQEVGRVINPIFARGQIEGGVVQGIGWALSEECRWVDGAMENAQLSNYSIPTALDVPEIRISFLEAPYENGPGGAKGIGELPLGGPAAAIANAISSATGCEPNSVPCSPEYLSSLLSMDMVE